MIRMQFKPTKKKEAKQEMEVDFALILELLKKLLLFIFEKYEVDKEFEALGVDVAGLFDNISSLTKQDEA